MTTTPDSDTGLSPLENLDRLIHEPARLLIMAHLYLVESADFLFLKTQTGLSKGNLSSHMSKLEEAGYVEIIKEFIGRKPHTLLKLTPAGRAAFQRYRDQMQTALGSLDD